MANVKLKRLKIGKLRHVAPGTELFFNDTFNVLLGQNGTGKTTLLRLISMAVRSDFWALKDEDFELECEHVYPGFTVTTSLRNQPARAHRAPSVASEASRLDLSSLAVAAPQWSCRLALRIDGVQSGDLLVYSSDSRGTTVEAPSIPGSNWSGPPANPFDHSILQVFTQSMAETLDKAAIQESASPGSSLVIPIKLLAESLIASEAQERASRNGGRFDEALGAFDVITGKPFNHAWGDLSWASIALRATEQDPLYTFVPPQLIELLRKGAASSDIIRIPHDELEFLKKAVSVLGLTGAEMRPHLLKKERTDQGDKTRYGDFEFLLTLDDGSIINHDDLSYGQKRLLSFLYYAAANPDIVIADELVNGMHYDWIEVCVHEIGDRQAFLTSQNPLLLDFLTFESAEEVARSFVLCSREKHGDRTRMAWRNMSDEDARGFFRAYQTEAQHVSEILRTKGLW